MMNLPVVQVSIAVLIGFVVYRHFRKEAGPGLPPGPKPVPIVGNIVDLPPQGMPEFQHWLKHKETYGPISSVTLIGQTLVFLHDKQMADYLLHKTSKKSSGRPTTEFANMLCGFGDFLVCQQYGDYFRQGRKFMHQELGSKEAVGRFHKIQELEVRRFLLRVLNQPETLIKHLRTKAGAMILKMAYGYSIEPNKADPLVDLIGLMMANFSVAAVPLGWLVDVIPALKYLPDGFPFTAFKDTARRWNIITKAAAEIPYLFVKRQVANGRYRSSYVANLIQQRSNDAEGSLPSHDDEHVIKWTAASLYAGASDTTVASLSCFILAMIMFPEVQYKAQQEIERVVGNRRLPQFEDRDKLPYIEGVVKETYRWHPVAPLGFPHVTSEDTIYSGYLIPKGANIIPAVWWFCHDPNVYADPNAFDPERYLEPRNEPDPKAVTFGYGRRTCPGQHFADSSIFLTIVQTLAAFDICKAVNELGEEIESKLKPTPGLISYPVDFPYKIVSRGAKQGDLIRSIEVEHPWEESDTGLLETEGAIIGEYVRQLLAHTT